MTTDKPTGTEAEPAPQKAPFQFGLKHLLAVPVWLALLFAAAFSFGAPGVVIFLLLNVFVVGIWIREFFWLGVLALLVLLVIGLFMPVVQTPREAAPRSRCANSLKQIALALDNYHDDYGCFPPAYIADDNGRPIHSWRVLILPYVEQQVLYDQYRFDEPWDGPNNRRLVDIPLQAFNCPSDYKKPSPMTSYVAVVGPDTAWPESGCTKIDDFADGTSNTLLVVEVANSGIHWMEPRDLHMLQMAPAVNANAGQGISSEHADGANVAFADGHIDFLPDSVSPEELRALLTIAGGEPIDSETW